MLFIKKDILGDDLLVVETNIQPTICKWQGMALPVVAKKQQAVVKEIILKFQKIGKPDEPDFKIRFEDVWLIDCLHPQSKQDWEMADLLSTMSIIDDPKWQHVRKCCHKFPAVRNMADIQNALNILSIWNFDSGWHSLWPLLEYVPKPGEEYYRPHHRPNLIGEKYVRAKIAAHNLTLTASKIINKGEVCYSPSWFKMADERAAKINNIMDLVASPYHLAKNMLKTSPI